MRKLCLPDNKRVLLFALAAVLLLPVASSAQQQVTIISRCGGLDSVTIPPIVDNDQDGMDDGLEQILLDHFMPTIIQFDNESCPGPALNGTGDSNLVVCHIFPLPQQYVISTSLDSVKIKPKAVVGPRGLFIGLTWYPTIIKVNTAILYGKDCGAAGHTADVEGFNYSLQYTGSDPAGWMYDTDMANWAGGVIQSVSHAGTLCEQVETQPYKSVTASNMFDTIYASPDKHGNYLTTGKCGSSFICNPGCGGIRSVKIVRAVNVGEPGASLTSNLGTFYPAYAGEDPWSGLKFLQSQGGDAGSIKDKMLLSPSSSFIKGQKITSQSQICGFYTQCYGPPAYTFNDYTCNGAAYTFNGRQLSAPGTYRDTVSTSYGCDSTVTLTLSVLAKNTFSYTASICNGNSYSFNGQQLTGAGIYMDTLTSSLGCDSFNALTLEITAPSVNDINASVCSGSAYTFNGQQLTSSGFYSDTLINLSGCDSIVNLTLNVDSLPTVVWNQNAENVNVNAHPILLTGANPSGGTFAGTGVAGNLFYPDSAGPGQHSITYTYTDVHGCSGQASINAEVIDTAATGINDADIDNAISFYPNPASGRLQLLYAKNLAPTSISIYNAVGDLMQKVLLQNQNYIDISTLSQGLYFIQFAFNGRLITKKLVIQ